MATDGDRPQDAGRKHKPKRAADPAAAALLDRYLASMRAELADLLDSLAPVPQDQGLGMVDVPPKRPDRATRSRTWDLAIKLGRELGAAIDPTPLELDAGTPAGPRRISPKRLDLG
jgi:hypothetical protein